MCTGSNLFEIESSAKQSQVAITCKSYNIDVTNTQVEFVTVGEGEMATRRHSSCGFCHRGALAILDRTVFSGSGHEKMKWFFLKAPNN